MSLFDLSGKKALVTGGNRSLGRGMAEALCEAGASVVILASGEHVHEAAAEMRQAGYDVQGLVGNLMQREAVAPAFDKALELLGGKLDILVNSAGIQRRSPCEDFPLADWDDVLRVNLTAVFELCQLAGRVMLAQGKGKIINMASMLSFFGGHTVPAYAASKGGVAQLTKALANEWTARGVNVNAIAPGYFATEMNIALVNDEERNKGILARIPAGRWGMPDDMKGTIVYLASTASDYVSGAIIPVDGGYWGK